ncbi:BTAD domain-containing putative transcriptional regulator [Streptomyces sp. NPDC002920]
MSTAQVELPELPAAWTRDWTREEWLTRPGGSGGLHSAPAETGLLDVRRGWPLCMAYQLLGEPVRSLDIHRRTAMADGRTPDEIMSLSWAAAAHLSRMEPRQARAFGHRALQAARLCGHPGAQAVAYATAASVATMDGDSATAKRYRERAQETARRSKDPLLVLLTWVSVAPELIEQGASRATCAALGSALDAAFGSVAGSDDSPIALAALCQRGAAHLALGELDQAISDFGTALAGYQRLGESAGPLALGARALLGLGDAHRERGELSPARAAYQEAAVLTEHSGDRQVLASALNGLARVRCTDDQRTAVVLAQRAVNLCTGPMRISALLAVGWIALADDRRESAVEALAQAASAPRAPASRAALAELLELEAMCAGDPRARQRLLEDAETLWTAAGRPMGAAKAAVARARLSGAGGTRLREATARLDAFGVSVAAADAAGLLNQAVATERPSLTVRVLGCFQVLREGRSVGAEEWQSKKARDLLALLVTRRGRPVVREVLMDALWPEESPARCANRLSVALSTIRVVLDPQRRMAQDHFIVADKHAIGIARLRVDVEEFLTAARTALSAARRAESGAFSALATAEAMYTGDVLEDAPYAQWADGLREETKALHLELLAKLAGAAAEEKDHHAEVYFRLRLLERDNYDEQAHLGLVSLLTAAGRHGEARRRYARYIACMEEIDVTPAPFPGKSS